MNLTDANERHMLKHPAYKEGHDACLNGALYEQNPHIMNSLEHEHWANGFCDAEIMEYDDVERD